MIHPGQLPAIGMQCSDAFGSTACKLKLVGPQSSCDGTVLVPCNGYLQFFYDENGNFDYMVDGGGSDTSAQVEEGVEAGASSGSGLRGAKSSNRLL